MTANTALRSLKKFLFPPIAAAVFVLAFCLGTQSASAAATQVSLALSQATVSPGSTTLVGVHFQMQSSWHIYWRNPGGSGIATRITWDMPAGVTAGPIQWPVPELIHADEFSTFVYDQEVVLLVPLTIASNVPAGPLELKAHATWLECSTVCVPGRADATATLNVGSPATPSTNSTLITEWQKKLPLSDPNFSVQAWWTPPTNNTNRTLNLSSATITDFYPYPNKNVDLSYAAPTNASPNGVVLTKTATLKVPPWPQQISGLVLGNDSGTVTAHEVDLKISDSAPISAPAIVTSNSTSIPTAAGPSLGLMLLYAFVGGLFLNIMPCVLPVIALKILGFVQQGGSHPARVRQLGFIYALGVLCSFLALAGLVVGLKAAGHQAGWGFQFGNPIFLVVMCVLITLVALNLFGIFEVNLNGRAMNISGDLSSREGASGAFFNGVLATILATPCSAPFLGIALGFAFAQSYAVIVLIFICIALGLALPYVILSCNPALLKLLPRPGVWMEKFKNAMGFPMLATLVWLLDLATAHYGRKILWLGLFLVLLAFAAWIFGEFVQRSRRHRGLALSAVVLILSAGYLFALENNLHWRMPPADAETGVVTSEANGIPWQRWSREAVTNAIAGGHPVLVDFTADWCTVCQVNRKTSLEVGSVINKLKTINAVALVADYTKLPPAISEELSHFGRAAVPLILVYPAKPGAAPEILPDGYLNPGIVLAALDRATKNAKPAIPASTPATAQKLTDLFK